MASSRTAIVGNPGPGLASGNPRVVQNERAGQHLRLFTDLHTAHDNRAQADRRASAQPDRGDHQIAALAVVSHDAGRTTDRHAILHFDQRGVGNGGRIDGDVAADLHAHQTIVELRER
jgi:hypothetical protein